MFMAITPANTYYGISVILPVYNGAEFLMDNIESVLKQDFENFELLISDDGSCDGSRGFLKELEQRNLSNVKVFYQQKNGGLYSNLNFLIRKCKYPLIHLWSQDDIMKPSCLRETITFHNRYTNISMSYSARDYIDAKGKLIPEEKVDTTPSLVTPNDYANICIRWGCITGNIANVTLVKEYIEKLGYFNENIRVSGDYELFTRFGVNSNIGFINKKLVYLRRHESSFSKVDSSIIYFIREDIPIYNVILSQFKGQEKKIGDLYWRWKVQVRWMNDVVFLLRRGNFRYTYQVYNVLKENFNINILFLRWIIIRTMRFIKKDNWFYQYLEGNL